MGELSQRIVERLRVSGSPERAELAQQLVEHLLSQRLRDLVTPEELWPILLATLTRENLARDVTRHVQAGVRRYSAHVAQAPERVGDLMPEEARASLRAQLEQPTGARARWSRGAVDPALLKRLLAPVWVQLLVNFAKRIPLPGLGAGSMAQASGAASAGRGIAGMLGRSVQQRAERLVGAGRSALEGLGIDVEKKLLAAARDFSDGAMSIFGEALRERLRSPEGREIVVQIKHGVLEHVLRTKLSDIDRDAVALPLAPYIDLAPPVVAHALHVPFVRKFIEGEIESFFALEGDRPVAELLDELGALDPVRTWLVKRAGDQLASYCESEAFGSWLSKLVDTAQQS